MKCLGDEAYNSPKLTKENESTITGTDDSEQENSIYSNTIYTSKYKKSHHRKGNHDLKH